MSAANRPAPLRPEERREVWNEIYRNAARVILCVVCAMGICVAALAAWHGAHPTRRQPNGRDITVVDGWSNVCAWLSLALLVPCLAMVPLWSGGRVTRRLALPVVLGSLVVAILLAVVANARTA